MKKILFLLSVVFSTACFSQKRNPANKAVYLEDISWTVSQPLLTPDAVVVIPLGAGAKEHGPHLPLSTDFIQAEGLAKLVALQRKVIITPVVNYGFYPAFLKYPGSTSSNFRTATDMVVQIVRSLAGYGPKRFYIINIGVSTTPTLETAAKTLAEEGILLYFSRYDRPAFDKAGTVTAGNASGLNDGAAAVIMMSAKKAAELGLPVLAKIKAYSSAGIDPTVMGLGPVPASQLCLKKAGWTHEEVDLMEINEAFAAQAIGVNREMGWDTSKINVNGGAIAIGHPIGASGCRILVSLIHEMIRRDAKRGLASLCIGGGMGVALAIERA